MSYVTIGLRGTVKIFLLIEGEARRKASLPHEDADHALVDGACPLCRATPWGVQGTGRRPSKDDLAWEADAVTTCCKKHVGVIRAEMNTLFGVREDAAVLNSRCRVY
jgi:hypothetical protein